MSRRGVPPRPLRAARVVLVVWFGLHSVAGCRQVLGFELPTELSDATSQEAGETAQGIADGPPRPIDDGAGSNDTLTSPDGGDSTDSRADTASSVPPADAPAAKQRWLMGYYMTYQDALLPAEQIPWGSLTHLAIGAVLPQSDGSLDTSFYSRGLLAESLPKLAKAQGVRPIMMVGGAGSAAAFSAAAAPATRAGFVRALVDYAKAHGYDGMDLDIEPLDPTVHSTFEAVARAIREAWPDVVLTMPIAYVNGNIDTVDPWFARVTPLFDQLNVMTYGMAGAFDGWSSWHSSALSGETSTTPTSVRDSLERYVAAGVPASKLGAGAGFYGICYGPPIDAPRQPIGDAVMTAIDNEFAYHMLVSSYLPIGAKKWDDIAQVPYLTFGKPVGDRGCTYISYEDERSLLAKGNWLRDHGFGGAIVWTINEGHLRTGSDLDPLLTSLSSALR